MTALINFISLQSVETGGAIISPHPLQPVAAGGALVSPRLPIGSPGCIKQDWVKEKGRAHEVFSRRRMKLGKMFAEGVGSRAEVRSFLRDKQVRLSASLRALGGNPTREEAYALRDQSDPWADVVPHVKWYPKRKANGGFRPVCVLPLQLKSVHYMIGAVVEAHLPCNSSIYGVSGASRDDAAHALKTLQNSGFCYLAAADIKNCFQGINPDAIYQLPLPKEVIRKTLDVRNMTFTTGTEFGVHSEPNGFGHSREYIDVRNPSGPQGLLQGSPASNIILAWLLRSIPNDDNVAVLLCFDNIAVAGRTAEVTRQMMDTLADFFRRFPAGPLELHDYQYTNGENDLLEFLGYSFDPQNAGPAIAATSLDKMEDVLQKAEAADLSQRPLLPTELMHALRSRRNGFAAAAEGNLDMSRLVDSARDAAAWRNHQWSDWLLKAVFEPNNTIEGSIVRAVLRDNPPCIRKKE